MNKFFEALSEVIAEFCVENNKEWKEEEHPRKSAGTPEGGQFAKKGESSTQKITTKTDKANIKEFKLDYNEAEKSKFIGAEGKSKSRYWEVDTSDYNPDGDNYINIRYSNHKYPLHNDNDYKEFIYNGIKGYARISFDSWEIDVVIPEQTNTNFKKIKPYIESIVNEWIATEKFIDYSVDCPIKIIGDVLRLKGKNVKEKRQIIADYYKTYLQSTSGDKNIINPNAINITLPNSSEKIYFSKKGLVNITHDNDFTRANFLPYLKDIIETGYIVNTDDENVKIVKNKVYFRGKKRDVDVTIKRDSNKEWYLDIKDIGSNMEGKID